MVEHENAIKLQEMAYDLEQTKKIAMGYKPSTDDSLPIEDYERQDLAEIVADNQILMARVEQLLTHDGVARVNSDFDEHYSLTPTLIDDLYEQAQAHAKEKRVKQQQKTSKQVVKSDWKTS